MEQLIAQYLVPIIGVALVVGFLIAGIRTLRRAEAGCGPGCVCAGERVRERQQQMIIQTPALAAYQQPQAQPQIIIIQQPAPQPVMYPQQQPQVIYLPAPTYQATPQPQAQALVSYYPGHSPEPTEYPQEVYYLPPAQPVGQLPPPRASDINEARCRFEEEREVMKRRR